VKKQASSQLDWRAKIFAMESRRLLDFERRIVDDFDESFLVSDIDRKFLFANSPKQLECVSVVSNGVDLVNLPFQFNTQGCDIAFIGNLHSLQNYDGAYFFAKDILPLIRLNLPNARFIVIGRIKPEQAAALTKFDNVVVTGEVGSIAQAAKTSRVGVCPIRLGAGIQNKVLEYMALGLPVVSTSIGLEGFSAKPGHDLLIADDAKQIASSVIFLLSNIQQANNMAISARKYAEENHSWDAILKPLVEKIVQHS
jgi:glycosyltransferase involved in cell wall biosynthesis